jgi:hypothetical protein
MGTMGRQVVLSLIESSRSRAMHSIIYIIGLIVVIVAILSFLGLA